MKRVFAGVFGSSVDVDQQRVQFDGDKVTSKRLDVRCSSTDLLDCRRAPDRAKDASDILWYLYHPNVYIYVDGSEDWSVHFESRCDNLGDDLLCRIYEQRPHICRGFDSETCEVNDHEHEALTFRQPGEFLDWLRANRNKIYKKVEKRFLPLELRPGPGRPSGKSKKGKKGKARKS